jgi:hypothetical protein
MKRNAMTVAVTVQPSSAKPSPVEVAAQIRHALRDGGSAEHAAGVQWFFKDVIKSHGRYTVDLRRASVRFRRELKKERGLDFLVEVADQLFPARCWKKKLQPSFCWKNSTPSSTIDSSSCSSPGSTVSAVGPIPMDSCTTLLIAPSWLLRETAKFDAKRTVPYLMKIRGRAPRLVLRIACETLPPAIRKKILALD